MLSSTIVEQLDIVKYPISSILDAPERTTVQLFLHAGEEGLRTGVIPAVSSSTHAR